MKLIKWRCECGGQLPEVESGGYAVCEKCGTKYRVDPELAPYSISQIPVMHVQLVEPAAPKITWTNNDLLTSGSGVTIT